MRFLTTSILMLASVSAATAQRAPAPGDTMRFQHITISTGEVESPMGPQKVTLEMRMQVAMTGLGGDSAVTWFDSVSVSGPIPGMSEMLDKICGQRMVTRFLPDGRVEINGLPRELNLAGSQLSPTALNFGLAMRGKLTKGTPGRTPPTLRGTPWARPSKRAASRATRSWAIARTMVRP